MYKYRNSYNFSGSSARVYHFGQSWRLFATVEITVVQERSSKDTNGHNEMPLVEITVTCYQVIGLNDQPEKDEIVKSGFTKDTMISRQIEESLEELAPACTLDLLGMPRSPENAERRLGAIAAMRELLRQGLDVETSCQVQDWSCFLSQALRKLIALEIVELIPWDSLALTRKNRKSLESQNQRIVIDFNSFYLVLLAHIALGFSSKQSDPGDEATAVERLKQLQQSSSTSSHIAAN